MILIIFRQLSKFVISLSFGKYYDTKNKMLCGGVINLAWLDGDVKSRLLMLLNLPRSVPLVWNLAWDKRIQWSSKLLFLGGGLAYFLLPYDVIPDWFPLLGQIDDLIVLFLLIERFLAVVPEHIIKSYY